jgi:hypothetical protein
MTTQASPAAFAALDRCVYMRRATTECGLPGWALFDGDGELIIFSERRGDIWFFISSNFLSYRWLN